MRGLPLLSFLYETPSRAAIVSFSVLGGLAAWRMTCYESGLLALLNRRSQVTGTAASKGQPSPEEDDGHLTARAGHKEERFQEKGVFQILVPFCVLSITRHLVSRGTKKGP